MLGAAPVRFRQRVGVVVGVRRYRESTVVRVRVRRWIRRNGRGDVRSRKLDGRSDMRRARVSGQSADRSFGRQQLHQHVVASVVHVLVRSRLHAVGTRVVRAALSQGLRVASVSRSGKLIADDPTLAGAEFLAADVEDKESLRRVLDGADAVVSCLGAPACPTKRLRLSRGVLATF